MRTRVKICGITRVDDGLAATRAGADAIGVVLWRGTPRHVDAECAAEIVRALPPFVKVVGLFVDPTHDAVGAALARIPLDALQFHAADPAAFCRGVRRPYLKPIAVQPGIDLRQYAARR